MCDLKTIKNTLLTDLWLPIIRKGGNMFYPRLKINKKMKVLTLTTDTNFEEINELVSEKITVK